MSKKSSGTAPKKAPGGASAPTGFDYVARFPGAREVRITGDFTQWSKEGHLLDHRGNGSWVLRLSLRPGEYQYRLLVDGAWADDPAAGKTIPNPFGGVNAVLVVR